MQPACRSDFGRTSFPTQICGYSAKQLRAAYGANLTNTGKGQTIALVELAPPDPDDLPTLQDYAKVIGPARAVQPSGSPNGRSAKPATCRGRRRPSSHAADLRGPEIEEQMDVEAAYAMAPGANEVVVAARAAAAVTRSRRGSSTPTRPC